MTQDEAAMAAATWPLLVPVMALLSIPIIFYGIPQLVVYIVRALTPKKKVRVAKPEPIEYNYITEAEAEVEEFLKQDVFETR